MIQGFTSHALVIYPLLMDYRGRGSRGNKFAEVSAQEQYNL